MDSTGLFDLKGQVAFVTGAAQGLGLAMSEVVAEHGATVVMTDIDGSTLRLEVGRLRERGLAVHDECLDVAETDKLARAIDDAAVRFGRLDIVFANAGLSAGPGPMNGGALADVDMARWNRLLNINLTSVFVTLRTAAAHMRQRRSGRLIVTASVAGIRADRMCGYAYAATKAAVANLVRQASLELSVHNITVNAIAPGPFLTNIGQGRLHQPEVAAAFIKDVPMGRLGEPSEIKGLALLLASPASSYITGTVIPVDGGASAS